MKKSFSSQVAELNRFFGHIKGRRFIYWSAMLSAVIFNSITEVLMAYINKGALNAISNSDMQEFKAVAIKAVIYMFISTIYPLTRYTHITIVRHIMYDFKSRIFHHMESLNLEYFEKNHSGDSIERLSNNVDQLKTAYFTTVFVLANTLIMGITSIVTMFVMEWRIAIILIVLGLISISISLNYTDKIRTLTDKVQKEASNLTQRLSDILSGFNVIKLFRGGDIAVKYFVKQNDKTNDLRMEAVKKKAEMDSVSFAFTFISNIGVIVLGVFMSIRGWTDIGTVAGIVTLQGSVNRMFLNLGSNYSRLQEYMSNAKRVFEILDEESEVERYVSGEIINKDSMITLEDVCFSYETRENVINNMNLNVKKGQRVALVGASGGGKSTVIKLLLGFYQISSGSIGIYGKAISEYNIQAIRDMIAYVPQDAYLFDGTIMENIGFGRLGATKEEIIEAAKQAYAHDFIEKLTDGYNTMLHNRGSNLSGGQRQRIAIARAFLKNAPILLLDEATSALDTESEQQVQISFEALMKNRTTIVVAHRLSTIESSDIIFVIENGTIVEKGTRDELMGKAGAYLRLSNVS